MTIKKIAGITPTKILLIYALLDLNPKRNPASNKQRINTILLEENSKIKMEIIPKIKGKSLILLKLTTFSLFILTPHFWQNSSFILVSNPHFGQ
jgi:hypothetical protein